MMTTRRKLLRSVKRTRARFARQAAAHEDWKELMQKHAPPQSVFLDEIDVRMEEAICGRKR